MEALENPKHEIFAEPPHAAAPETAPRRHQPHRRRGAPFLQIQRSAKGAALGAVS